MRVVLDACATALLVCSCSALLAERKSKSDGACAQTAAQGGVKKVEALADHGLEELSAVTISKKRSIASIAAVACCGVGAMSE